MNPYDVLEVSEDATDAEIKAAYKAKAQKAHPDREGGSLAIFKVINEAYRSIKEREDPADIKLRQLFEVIVDNEGFRGDIVVEAKRITAQTLDMLRQERRKAKNKLSRYETLKGRVDNPYYSQVVEGKIDHMVITTGRHEFDIKVLEKVTERLESLEDSNPDPSWVPAGGFGGV